MNNHHNDNTPVYLVEKHTRLEKQLFHFVKELFFSIQVFMQELH